MRHGDRAVVARQAGPGIVNRPPAPPLRPRNERSARPPRRHDDSGRRPSPTKWDDEQSTPPADKPAAPPQSRPPVPPPTKWGDEEEPDEADDSPPDEDSRPARRNTPRGGGSAAESEPATKWNVVIDPPAEDVYVSSDIVIPLPNEPRNGKALFPALTSRFVALGDVGHDGDVLAVWDFENIKLAGQFRGPPGVGPASPLALSPDGRFEEKKNHLGVWSSETGRQVADIALPEGKFRGGFLQFAGPRQLLSGLRFSGDDDEAIKVQTWNIPDVRPAREFTVAGNHGDFQRFGLSPGGRYLAVGTARLEVYDLDSGKPAGVRRFSGIDSPVGGKVKAWSGRAVAFSPDGGELLALLDGDAGAQNGFLRIVVWDVSSGNVVAHHTAEGNWAARVPGFSRATERQGRSVEWFDRNAGWLIAGYVAVDRASGKGRWGLDNEPNRPVRLVNGNRLLGVARGESFHCLVACDVSPDNRPDLERGLAVQSQAPREYTVHFKILAYSGQAPALPAANQALAKIPWIKQNTVAIDRPNREIVASAVGVGVDATAAKKALHDAGFKVGEVSVKEVENSEPDQ
jgi:hypothetical protein